MEGLHFLDWAMEDLPYLDWTEVEAPGNPEYHDVATITVQELVSDGILTRERWDACDWYDDAQRDRLWNKFIGRYAWREIGILPIRKKREVLPAGAAPRRRKDDGGPDLQKRGIKGRDH